MKYLLLILCFFVNFSVAASKPPVIDCGGGATPEQACVCQSGFYGCSAKTSAEQPADPTKIALDCMGTYSPCGGADYCTPQQAKMRGIVCTKVDPPPCEAGDADNGSDDGQGGQVWSSKGVTGGSSFCDDGCVATGKNVGNVGIGNSSGGTEWWTNFINVKHNGSQCTVPPDTGGEGKKPDLTCGPTETKGTLNGVEGCFPKGPDGNPEIPKVTPPEVTTTTTTKTNADGTKTTTTTTKTTTTGGDGSKSTTTSTTTTTKGADGTETSGTEVTKEDKTDPEKNDFCKQNPSLSICKDHSVSGTCATTTCEGDAITCSILKTQQKRDCEDHDQENGLYKFGQSLIDGLDPLKDSLPSIKTSQDVDMTKDVDASGWGGGGSCFADKSFTVMNQTITIPFSNLCQYLEMLRYAIMLIASITSFKMLSGSILRD